MPYADKTRVPVQRSKNELEALLRRRGAQGFAAAWDQTSDRIEFLREGIRIRFVLPRATKRSPTAQEQHDRQRWRALILVIKAKLEAVDSGIAVFEEEFLANIVDERSDRTVGQFLVPRIQAKQQLLLGDSEANR